MVVLGYVPGHSRTHLPRTPRTQRITHTRTRMAVQEEHMRFALIIFATIAVTAFMVGPACLVTTLTGGWG